MLEASKLTKRYNAVIALDALDLLVEPGQIYCLLGPNGAGKTTTINLFLGFIRPDGGTARVNGQDVASHSVETKKDLAYIPEQVNLYRSLTGLENLEFFTGLAGHDYPRDKLLEFLLAAGLPGGAADQRVGAYSKGMRQKVGIAIALAKNAKALLLDEPTSGLDPLASYEFSQLLRQLAKEKVAILMTTHDLFRAKEVGSVIGIMRRGTLVTTMSTEQFSHTDMEKIYLEYMK
ncbi:MAG TPA: ABC transporter ATP-binding protein [Methylocella sp.]|nr:ABC transporter ATP-binding protein [Methylocella sp.]